MGVARLTLLRDVSDFVSLLFDGLSAVRPVTLSPGI